MWKLLVILYNIVIVILILQVGHAIFFLSRTCTFEKLQFCLKITKQNKATSFHLVLYMSIGKVISQKEKNFPSFPGLKVYAQPNFTTKKKTKLFKIFHKF